jgi:hypothetical protein
MIPLPKATCDPLIFVEWRRDGQNHRRIRLVGSRAWQPSIGRVDLGCRSSAPDLYFLGMYANHRCALRLLIRPLATIEEHGHVRSENA